MKKSVASRRDNCELVADIYDFVAFLNLLAPAANEFVRRSQMRPQVVKNTEAVPNSGFILWDLNLVELWACVVVIPGCSFSI